MADTPGEPSKASDPKIGPEPANKPADASKPADAGAAASRSAAVKPPVLDLKAREAKPEPPKPEPAKPAAPKKPDEKPADKPARPLPPKPEPSATRAAGNGAPVVAAIAGGVLGLAAAYGLAWGGLWPTPPVAPPAEDPRLAQYGTSLGELETVTSTTQSELAALNQRIAAVENAEPSPVAPAEPVDVAGLEADIAALSGRLDTLSAAPAPSVDPGALSGLKEQLTALGGRLDEIAARVGTAEAGLRELDTAVAETNQTLSAQPEDIGAVLQLPLIVSGLETAFSLGRPFQTELAALREAAPDRTIAPELSEAAATGLARPDTIATELQSALPAMLAARPANPDAGWQQGALDWLSASVALRPTGEVEGDSPDAVLSRLEAAVLRRDFVAADELMASLPEPMRAAAATLPQSIAEQAEAQRLLADVRAGVLAGGGAS